MLLQGLQDGVIEARKTYHSFGIKVHRAANDTRQEVLSSLQSGMQLLINVVKQVHATYSEDEQMDDSRQDILKSMEKSFKNVEEIAKSRRQDLANLHEEIVIFQAGTINRLQVTLNELAEEARRTQSHAEETLQRTRIEQKEAMCQREEARAIIEKWQSTVDDPALNVGASIIQFWPPALIVSLIGKQFVDKGTPTSLQELLDSTQRRLSDLRVVIETQTRLISELEADNSTRMRIIDESSTLIRTVEPISIMVQNLTNSSEKFKELLIRIKGSATGLAKEASQVDASVSVANRNAYTKSDFAQGILNICQEALFDVMVQKDVEEVLRELKNVWTINNQSNMPPRLKKRFDEVQSITNNYKQDGKNAEWDALFRELAYKNVSDQGLDGVHGC